jgi:hypothetical protein
VADEVAVDLSSEVRDALLLSLERTSDPIGFFIRPGLLASTRHDRAVRELVRGLVDLIMMTATGSASHFVFDSVAKDEAVFYTISLLARRDALTPRIAPRVDAQAVASGAFVWDVDPGEGEAAVVWFAIDAGDSRVVR